MSSPSRKTGEREARIAEIEANFHLCRCGRGDVGCVDEDTARWLIAELRSALSELSAARKDAERWRSLVVEMRDDPGESPRCYCGHGASAHVRAGSCCGVYANGHPCNCTEYAASRSEETANG